MNKAKLTAPCAQAVKAGNRRGNTMTDAVKPCPNPECRAECHVGVTNVATGCPWDVRCPECGYHGPYGHVTVYGTSEDFSKASRAEAIRLHNLICTPPAGWKLVPVEPTEAMINASCDGPAMSKINDLLVTAQIRAGTTFDLKRDNGKPAITEAWENMILAAPENDDEQS